MSKRLLPKSLNEFMRGICVIASAIASLKGNWEAAIDFTLIAIYLKLNDNP